MLIGGKDVVICNCCLIIHRDSIGAKTALCGICLRKFLSKKQRDKHMECHTREKKYRCKQCSRDFVNSWNCKLHERTCAKQALQNKQEQTASNSSQSTINQIGGGGTSSVIEIDDGNFTLNKSALNNALQVF